MQNTRRRLTVWAGVVALILFVPLVAMQFTAEVDWDLFDFVFIGALLFGAGLTYELIARTRGTAAYRLAIGVAVATAVLLVWVNGAVGIIGDGPVNGLYLAVLLVGFGGVIVTGPEPQGMSRALVATALAMALIPVIALIIGTSDFAPGVAAVFILNTCFVLLFVASALLFRRAFSLEKGGSTTPLATSVVALGLVAIGVAIAATGIYISEIDDAPGAALIGILLMIGAMALGVRTVRRKV